MDKAAVRKHDVKCHNDIQRQTPRSANEPWSLISIVSKPLGQILSLSQ